MKLRYTRRAVTELLSAYEWYEGQQSGLGSDFLRVFRRLVSNVAEHPAMYPRHRDAMRRAFMRRFPYSVFYRVEDDTILVIAVFGTSRSPESKP
jgi:plasmid stabilization system protein ParE